MEARLEAVENGGDVAHLMATSAPRPAPPLASSRCGAHAEGGCVARRPRRARASQEHPASQRRGHRRRARENATPAFIDRLMLDEKRVAHGDASNRRRVPDPVGEVIASWQRRTASKIEACAPRSASSPSSIESRPNVTRCGALSIKGEAVILPAVRKASAPRAPSTERWSRGGARRTARRRAAIRASGPRRGRLLLAGLDGMVDVVVPRAARASSVGCRRRRAFPCSRISKASAMSMLHAPADLETAKKIVLKRQMRRTGVCGAAETLLVDKKLAATHLKPLVAMLIEAVARWPATRRHEKWIRAR